MKTAALFVLVGQLALAMATAEPAQASTSVEPTTTVCKTITSTITKTVTLTSHSSVPVVPIIFSSYSVPVSSELNSSWISTMTNAPVVSTSADAVVTHNSSLLTASSGTSTVLATTQLAPYPTHNGTAGVAGTVTGTAPHYSSGTGVAPSSSVPLTVTTSGGSKAITDRLFVAMVVVGGFFLTL